MSTEETQKKSRPLSNKFESIASNQKKCVVCNKTVYRLEELIVDSKSMHKGCFKCAHCKRQLTLGNFAAVNSKLYCKTHYVELFKSTGGNYEVFGDAGFKHKATGSTPPVSPIRTKDPAVKSFPKVEKRLETRTSSESVDSGKLSIKERMAMYQSNASNKSTAPPVNPKLERMTSVASAATRSVSTTGDFEETDVCESSSEGDDVVTDEEQDMAQTISNDVQIISDLQAKNEKLMDDNSKLLLTVKKLNQTLAQVKRELSEEVAKSMAADEWCAKLSLDIDKLKKRLATQPPSSTGAAAPLPDTIREKFTPMSGISE